MARCRFSGQGRADAEKLPKATCTAPAKQAEEGWEEYPGTNCRGERPRAL